MRSKKPILILMIGACCGMAQLAHAQGFGMGEGLPRHEITNVTGDLYRFRQTRHFGMFLVTADGIILVDPTNSEAAAWLKEQLDERFGLPVKYVIYSHGHNDHASGIEHARKRRLSPLHPLRPRLLYCPVWSPAFSCRVSRRYSIRRRGSAHARWSSVPAR